MTQPKTKPSTKLAEPSKILKKIAQSIIDLEENANNLVQEHEKESKKLFMFRNNKKILELKQKASDAKELVLAANQGLEALRDFTKHSAIASNDIVESQGLSLEAAIANKRIDKLKNFTENLIKKSQGKYRKTEAPGTQTQTPQIEKQHIQLTPPKIVKAKPTIFVKLPKNPFPKALQVMAEKIGSPARAFKSNNSNELLEDFRPSPTKESNKTKSSKRDKDLIDFNNW